MGVGVAGGEEGVGEHPADAVEGSAVVVVAGDEADDDLGRRGGALPEGQPRPTRPRAEGLVDGLAALVR
jgi:hypothetical protein